MKIIKVKRMVKKKKIRNTIRMMTMTMKMLMKLTIMVIIGGLVR